MSNRGELMSPFALIVLEPATTIYAGGIAAAARQIVRTPGLEAQLEAARVAASGKLPIPPELRAAYSDQVARSHSFVESHDFGMMQTYADHTIPLIRQDWVKSVTVPAPAHDLLPDLLKAMRIEPRAALGALHASPTGAAYVDVIDGVVSIHAPNEPTLASLICTVHELGHYYYEILDEQPDPNSFAHYLESEAAALAFCYEGILTFLVTRRGGRLQDLESWEEYFHADLMLNHYFFLEEAQCVGLFQGVLPQVGMKFLRDNRTKLFGYQIVYASASTLAEAHALRIVDSLRDATRHPSGTMRAIARAAGAAQLYSSPPATKGCGEITVTGAGNGD
jgi:hypothetical protein